MVQFDTLLLVGQLAPPSLAGYQHDLRAYLAFCGDVDTALQASSLLRWRLHLVQTTRLSPHTINRRMAAVKRVIEEAAAQGSVDQAKPRQHILALPRFW